MVTNTPVLSLRWRGIFFPRKLLMHVNISIIFGKRLGVIPGLLLLFFLSFLWRVEFIGIKGELWGILTQKNDMCPCRIYFDVKDSMAYMAVE